MAHARQQIREAVYTLLNAWGVWDVYETRIYPVEITDKVAICIYTLNETVTESTLNNDQLRSLQMAVEIKAKALASVDDDLDEAAGAVEQILAADDTFSGLAKRSDLVETEVDYFDELEKRAAVMRLIYDVQYRVNKSNPNVIVT